MRQVYAQTSVYILSGVLLLSGCTSTLVRDDVKRTAGLDGHCAGSEWVDDSLLAVLPVLRVQVPVWMIGIPVDNRTLGLRPAGLAATGYAVGRGRR